MFKAVLAILILVGLLAAALTFSPSALASPPANFERIQVLSSGLNNPTALEFAPDGRLFILEQGGAIKIYKNGQLLPRFFDELPALAENDRGLLGIAFDPEFSSNHFVYFYYINQESKHFVVRFDASGDIAKNGPVTIWASNTVAGSNHAGGTIQFGPDGKLYIGIGDSGNPPNAQDLSNPMGKILRINKDGTIPADNPFAGDSSRRGEIWAYGFRNPFRFQFDKVSGDLWVGDVGNESWEEVNKVVKRGNYGWPLAEGNCTSCAFINPVYTYFHTTSGYSVTGGLIYRGNLFPESYKGSYIFGDYARGFIKRLTFDSSGNQNGVVNFDTAAGSIVDLKTAPDGSIYYLNIFPPGLSRINYTLGNKTPIVKAVANPPSGHEPLTVNFSSSGSMDPENTPLTYRWDFGDGTTSLNPNPVKTYGNVGKFSAFLTVSDGQLSAKSIPLEVSVGTPPVVSFTTPADNLTYKAGDIINYQIVAKDKSGVDLPSSAVSFESVFHHNTHIHPFLRPVNQKSGNFTIPQSGEASPDTWYELRATATDSNNLSATKTINIRPQKTRVTLMTNPANFNIKLDGTPQNTAVTFEGVVGFKREIDAFTQKISGAYYEFDHWSDGGAKKHIITLPSTATTYTAAFRAQPPFLGQYFNNPNFSGTPIFTRNDPVINFDWGNGSPDSRIPNEQFSARWSKKQFFQFGRYRFTGFSDDQLRVYLDGTQIINTSFTRGVISIRDIPEGLHDLRVDFVEEGGGASVGLSWDLTADQPNPSSTPRPTVTPGPTVTPTPTASPTLTPRPTPSISPGAYRGEYFANQNLAGNPALIRSDPQINFVWNESRPAPGLPEDQFSVRWTKTANFNQGLYHFNLAADDGVRLFIDGQKVLDRWVDQPVTNYSVEKFLTTGSHTITVEYYEAFGGAIASLNYSLVDLPQEFRGEYFDNKTLSGLPKLIRQDPKINFVWNLSSPAPQIPADNFSVRWTKKQLFKTGGTYAFTLKSDDGIRFWVDNQLIVNDWRDHGMITYTPRVPISAGVHTLKVEFYDSQGDAVAILNQDN